MTYKELLYEIVQNQVRQIELLESIEEKLIDEKPPVPSMTRKELRQLKNQIQQYPIENKSESSEQL